jgi:DNA-binding NarL/FixJ family response regulator
MSFDRCSALLASSDRSLRIRWQQALVSECVIHKAGDWAETQTSVRAHYPRLILLDDRLPVSNVAAGISALTALAPGACLLLMHGQSGVAHPVAAVTAGASGFCSRDAAPALLVKAAHSLLNGELWVPRRLVPELIAALSKQASSAPKAAASTIPGFQLLTPRELEVVEMVNQSANNKSIARALNITERTVKAHLSAVFRKLNVSSRLRLAILFKNVQ